MGKAGGWRKRLRCVRPREAPTQLRNGGFSDLCQQISGCFSTLIGVAEALGYSS
ncbi:hypothetical protein C1H46_045609 [Malus baccata]|uniref:Uncharacterized protein n=1 Tax=Malus baccata TaxID=106549 RepID=A0A540K3R1_MALBA|nr:hypothetical protein C1H46_045609 [Malus baccata]